MLVLHIQLNGDQTTREAIHRARPLDFNLNDTGADSITRSQGSWLEDGFLVGQTITVSGTTL